MIKFCSLFSGSSGNAIFLGTEKTKLLIDAGLSGKMIMQALNSIGEDPSELNAILVSHEHSDHIKGAGIMSRRFGIPIYANDGTWEAMESAIGQVEAGNLRRFDTGDGFEIGDISVRAFPIPHDAREPVGFNFFARSRKITVATDIGHMNRELLECFDKSDLILLESNHDTEMLKVGPYPWVLKQRIMGRTGHLSNDTAGKVVAYMAERGTENFLLGHLSKENNFPELAYQTACAALQDKGIEPGRDIRLDVVLRDRTGKVVNL
jgi:phosphoribosyl 1,2-cyclic phosphodiesterase